VPPFAVKNAELYVAAKVRSKDMSYVPLVAAGKPVNGTATPAAVPMGAEQ